MIPAHAPVRLAAARAMLRLLHEHRRYPLAWIAKELGVSQSLIIRWRDGSHIPTDDDLDRLRALLRRTKP
jgi:transcriptional regulator with XRE-family HTH domain